MYTTQHHLKIKKWLYPVSFLYGLGVRVRNKCFDWGILKQQEFPIPVICIGNLTVGGTGKTPHTELLVSILKEKYNVAVLSRGYKRKTKGFILSDEKSNADTIGDEPFQIKSKFPDITVAVDANRRRGIKQLMALSTPKIDVIILDDAYQHRYVKAGFNMLLVDSHRPICEDKLLPAGLLREPINGKIRANMVVVTKCPTTIKPIDFNIATKKLDLFPFQKLFFSNFNYQDIYPVFEVKELQETNKLALSSLSSVDNILLLSGIANPTPLVNKLKEFNPSISTLHYKDHHDFNKEDIKNIEDKFNSLQGENKLIITTEKDATRLVENPDISDNIKSHVYCLPINVGILQDKEDAFTKNILDYVRENKRNS